MADFWLTHNSAGEHFWLESRHIGEYMVKIKFPPAILSITKLSNEKLQRYSAVNGIHIVVHY